jgi:hypothetical protein
MPYIGVSPFNGVRKKHTYTATASQTSFSGVGAEGITLSYKDSTFVDVFQNGVKLGEADYTSTSGTAIVLAQGASLNDLIEVVVYDVFSVADTVSKADGGTFDGAVTLAGGVSGDVAFDTSTLKVDSSNNRVGIGTASPSTSLNVVGGEYLQTQDSADTVLTLTSTSNSGRSYQIRSQNSSGEFFVYDNTAGASRITVDSNGHVTKPSQSAFQAAPSSDINNITGDATTASLTNVAYTETFDVNDDFNHDDGTNRGKFTAPVTGKYYLGYTLCYSGVTSASTSGVHALSTSNRTYNNNFNPYNHANVGVNGNIVFSAICDMDANDTAHVTLYVNGNGSKVVDILSSQHKFFGMLIG